MGERVGFEEKTGNDRIVGFSRKGFAKFGALKMLDVGRDFGNRQVVHAFVETSMLGNFDTLGVNIVPEDILSSVGKKTKKETFARVRDEFCTSTTRRANPDTATKGAKVSKIVFVTSRNGDG